MLHVSADGLEIHEGRLVDRLMGLMKDDESKQMSFLWLACFNSLQRH